MGIAVLWIVIPVSILLLTGPVAANLFIALLEASRWRGLKILAAGLGLAAVILGIFITYTFGNFFPGVGCFISLLTPLVAGVTFLTFRFRARRFYAVLGDDPSRRRWFAVGTALLPLLQLLAPIIGFIYGQTCDALNRRAAGPLVAALEAYKTETGSYLPAGNADGFYQGGLEFLVPGYLSSIPPLACAAPIFNRPAPVSPGDADWSLYACNNNPGREVLLMAPIIGSDSHQIYNLSTRHWSRGNALDGYCSYLR